MSSIKSVMPADPTRAEQVLLRMITDAYRMTAVCNQNEIADIENDIMNVSAPAALGLSPEFGKWEKIVTAAGIVWEVEDDSDYIRVSF